MRHQSNIKRSNMAFHFYQKKLDFFVTFEFTTLIFKLQKLSILKHIFFNFAVNFILFQLSLNPR